jgi:hypothetical protein
MRSLRLAQRSFAAEAAQLTGISDLIVLSWPTDVSRVDADAKRKAQDVLRGHLDQVETTRGSQHKAKCAYELFRSLLPHLHLFAYHRRFLETQEAKCRELEEDCRMHMENPKYTREDCLTFLRLAEFCKAYGCLMKRILHILHNSLSQ